MGGRKVRQWKTTLQVSLIRSRSRTNPYPNEHLFESALMVYRQSNSLGCGQTLLSIWLHQPADVTKGKGNSIDITYSNALNKTNKTSNMTNMARQVKAA